MTPIIVIVLKIILFVNMNCIALNEVRIKLCPTLPIVKVFTILLPCHIYTLMHLIMLSKPYFPIICFLERLSYLFSSADLTFPSPHPIPNWNHKICFHCMLSPTMIMVIKKLRLDISTHLLSFFPPSLFDNVYFFSWTNSEEKPCRIWIFIGLFTFCVHIPDKTIPPYLYSRMCVQFLNWQ